jgi:hypothetical protein
MAHGDGRSRRCRPRRRPPPCALVGHGCSLVVRTFRV